MCWIMKKFQERSCIPYSSTFVVNALNPPPPFDDPQSPSEKLGLDNQINLGKPLPMRRAQPMVPFWKHLAPPTPWTSRRHRPQLPSHGDRSSWGGQSPGEKSSSYVLRFGSSKPQYPSEDPKHLLKSLKKTGTNLDLKSLNRFHGHVVFLCLPFASFPTSLPTVRLLELTRPALCAGGWCGKGTWTGDTTGDLWVAMGLWLPPHPKKKKKTKTKGPSVHSGPYTTDSHWLVFPSKLPLFLCHAHWIHWGQGCFQTMQPKIKKLKTQTSCMSDGEQQTCRFVKIQKLLTRTRSPAVMQSEAFVYKSNPPTKKRFPVELYVDHKQHLEPCLNTNVAAKPLPPAGLYHKLLGGFCDGGTTNEDFECKGHVRVTLAVETIRPLWEYALPQRAE